MDERRPIEELARAANVPAWLLAASKAYMRWADGQEVFPDDFADAVHAAANVQLGYGDTWSK